MKTFKCHADKFNIIANLENFFNNITSLYSLLFIKKLFINDCRILSFLPWLIMRVSFEIKGSKLESSVNKLNLFKVSIVSSTSWNSTSWNVELNGNFFVKFIFVKLVQCFILWFSSHFNILSFCGHSEHNTQATFVHALIFKKIKVKNSAKT